MECIAYCKANDLLQVRDVCLMTFQHTREKEK